MNRKKHNERTPLLVYRVSTISQGECLYFFSEPSVAEQGGRAQLEQELLLESIDYAYIGQLDSTRTGIDVMALKKLDDDWEERHEAPIVARQHPCFGMDSQVIDLYSQIRDAVKHELTHREVQQPFEAIKALLITGRELEQVLERASSQQVVVFQFAVLATAVSLQRGQLLESDLNCTYRATMDAGAEPSLVLTRVSGPRALQRAGQVTCASLKIGSLLNKQ